MGLGALLYRHDDWRCKIRLLSYAWVSAKWSGGVRQSLGPEEGQSSVCELGLLEWCFAKLAADEDNGEALQVCTRERMGGARQQNGF